MIVFFFVWLTCTAYLPCPRCPPPLSARPPATTDMIARGRRPPPMFSGVQRRHSLIGTRRKNHLSLFLFARVEKYGHCVLRDFVELGEKCSP